MNTRKAIKGFLEDRAVEYDLSPLTIYGYDSHLRKVLAPLLELDMRGLSTEHLKATLTNHRKAVAPRTYGLRLAILKLFSRWAFHENLWPSDFAGAFRSRRPKADLPRFLDSSDEVMEMASRLDPLSPHDIRGRAMLLVSYAGALRPGEMIALQLKDFLPTHNPPAIHVRTLKRGNDRYVLLFPQAQQALEEYLALARDICRPSAIMGHI